MILDPALNQKVHLIRFFCSLLYFIFQDDSEIFNISHSAFSLDDEFLVDMNAMNDPSDVNFTPTKKKIKKQVNI